jgi:Tfp pilus assembly protein PilE
MTLVEVMMASAIAVPVMATILTTVYLAVEEQRTGLVSATLQQNADLLEDRITRLLREMSASEAVALGDPIAANSPFYHQLITARGTSPLPREQLTYNPATFTCTHTPDRSSPTVQETYAAPSSIAVLRNMYLFISQKMDGTADASAVTVVFQMDDNGTNVRRKTNTVSRAFTVTMRNN